MLKIEGLTKTFKGQLFEKDHQVLKGLSFEVHKGRTTGFVGVNGAGKTTTLKCALGFVRPDQGKITFFGQGPLDSELKKRLGYLPERPYYYDFLTATQFLKFHWDLTGGGEGFESRAGEILAKVNLKNVTDKYLRSFSKGMLQRIGLAQALLRSPELLILDEPMSGLDPDGRMLIKEIIMEEKKKGTTLFFSSHLLGDMDELCDDLVVIDQGRLIFEGSLKDFAKDQGVEKSFYETRMKLGARI
ncbi:MAG: ABC transporter ATP-binding protein [Pseudobdellovibrionaceae bacterium]